VVEAWPTLTPSARAAFASASAKNLRAFEMT
jgi:hypothetical protein